MNLNLHSRIYDLIQKSEIDRAIELCEKTLSEIETTNFHNILDKNLLHLKEELIKYVEDFMSSSEMFFKRANRNFLNLLISSSDPKKQSLKAIYCEMNGFSINYDLWFIDLFAFSSDNGIQDTDWLAEFEYNSENSFIITGFETLQEAFRDYHENEKYNDEGLEKATETCELLIILRLQELFRTAYQNSNEHSKWKNIPIMATAHDYEIIYRTIP